RRSSVGSIILVSDGLAEWTVSARGTPSPSTTTTSLLPLPRLVFPTHRPPFLPARTSRRRSTRTSPAGPARPARRGTPPTALATRRPAPSGPGDASRSAATGSLGRAAGP